MIGTAAFEKIISNLSRLPSRPTIGAVLRQVIWQFRADMNGRPLDITGWAKPIESWKDIRTVTELAAELALDQLQRLSRQARKMRG